MEYKEIKVMDNNPTLTGLARLTPDVVFSTAQGVELKLQLLSPWDSGIQADGAMGNRYPLIVFVQGSGWTFPDPHFEMPQLAQLAQMGYVVASLTHRNSLEGHPFPAYLQDVKTAIRFLRANGDQYGVDLERVGIWGTSSGGNTSLLVALTGDDPRYKTEEYADYSDAVKLSVDCFGPTDVVALMQGNPVEALDDGDEFKNIFYALTNNMDMTQEEILHNMSPLRLVEDGKPYPPFLLIHGDADELVPYSQSEIMFRRLLDAGAEAEMICIKGAPHEGSFWSQALLQEIIAFINRNI